MIIVITLLAYFMLLFGVSKLTARRTEPNDSFFRAGRRSPWYMVAFGMVGASISGVTFVSVPGMVTRIGMTYLQTCMGFVLGYFVVAFILLPLYYKLNLTSIYTYLGHRFGNRTYKTGAWFFLLSKMSGAAVSFYVVCIILQRFVLDDIKVPFMVTVICMVALIWLYTRRGGIKTLVWTDSFQTLCLIGALILIIVNVVNALGLTFGDAMNAVYKSDMSRVFVFDDWKTTQNFWKQFFSGIFIVIVMTGLDQDKMQKNLTCKTLRGAQKDMCTYGFAFIPVNLLFMILGVLLVMLSSKTGVALPTAGDELLPQFAATGSLGTSVVVLFTIGIVAASFSSADSALTSMTTSYCVDICNNPSDEKLRRRAHVFISVVFAIFILLFKAINSTNVIDAIYILCSYTYGPLLGLFSFGLLSRRQVRDKAVPYIAVTSPVLCWIIETSALEMTGYKFGYELLMLNGLLTYIGLWVTGINKKQS